MKPTFKRAPLYWLALGTFAVGTEGFMIAAILPRIAADLSVSMQSVGLLVTIFALTYGLSSPILTAFTGNFDRRKLLILAMAAFAGANIVAARATGYWPLVFARILLAVSAGLYTPSASALAGALVPPEWRGRALAIVNGGFSVAVALGVPLGALIGNRFGWRMTFVDVAVLAAAAAAGLLVGIPRGAGAGLSAASLRERIAVVRQPAALSALLVTTLWGIAGYSVYTYIAPYLATVAGLQQAHIGYVLFLLGASAFTGLLIGGAAVDRIGSRRVIAMVLPVLAAALVSLSVSARYLSASSALIPVLIAIAVWGITGWSFLPAQQARVIGISGLKNASVILSLNASFQYLGFSLGAALGSLVITRGSVADLGWFGGLCAAASLVLFLATSRPARAVSPASVRVGSAERVALDIP
jgi:predicted MFS family arabinose efflux permease